MLRVKENGVWLSLYDVAVSWLRLQTPIDCIPHPYWMYIKCFSTLRCCGWAYGCILMLLTHGNQKDPCLSKLYIIGFAIIYEVVYLFYTCADGGEFLEKWGMAEPV